MRSLTDECGVRWDVAVGKESYGNLVLLFSRADSDMVLRATIAAASRLEAERTLRNANLDELRRLLSDASPWTPAAGGEPR